MLFGLYNLIGPEVGEQGKFSSPVKVASEVKEVKQIESKHSVIGYSKHKQDFIKKNIEVCHFFKSKMYDKRLMSKMFLKGNSITVKS